MQLNLATPSSALAIGAHPDDVEFGAGATLAKWAADGCVVNHLVCTDGSKGSWDPDADVAALIELRQREQRAAAAALGASGECVFLGWTDGELESGLEQRGQVAYWIRRLRPAVVLGHDPWKRWRLHPDHRHAGFLAVEGVVAARDPHFFRDHDLASHRPDTILLWEADEADHAEDVAGYLPAKVNALLAHASQFVSTHGIDDPNASDQVEGFRAKVESRANEDGISAGLGAAEVFKRIDT